MLARHSDRSIAAAIFANGTYFVDTPSVYVGKVHCSMMDTILWMTDKQL
jgi:hypothetical protein